MTKCLRIFRAYGYRFTRKHSTAILIAALIGTLFVILHLYHQHQIIRQGRQNVGDFDYIPGAFLKGISPNENVSYCQFNYGLPEKLIWKKIQIHTPPEGGLSSNHRVIYNAIKGIDYVNISEHDAVTYATQATPDFIYHIIEISRYWDGPISLAVFVPDQDLDLTMQIFDHLCHCYEGMRKVSLHLFYPKRFPPRLKRKTISIEASTPIPTALSTVNIAEEVKRKLEMYKNLNNNTRAEYIARVRRNKIQKMMARMTKKKFVVPDLNFKDCSGLDGYEVHSQRSDFNMNYPINVGRNVARNGSRTNYFLVSDIEMIPSERLASKFLTMVRKLMGDKKRDEGCVFSKTIFVVPLFEVERGEEIPRNKDELIKLLNANRAKYFHAKICTHCQRFPGLQSWLLKPSPDSVEPMLVARREYPYHRWEPLYFGTHKDPWYAEALSWEGRQDKMTQMLELCLQEYHMVVLDGGFLCHAAVTPKTKDPHKYTRAERNNMKHYLRVIADFKRRYRDRPQCKIDFGYKS